MKLNEVLLLEEKIAMLRNVIPRVVSQQRLGEIAAEVKRQGKGYLAIAPVEPTGDSMFRLATILQQSKKDFVPHLEQWTYDNITGDTTWLLNDDNFLVYLNREGMVTGHNDPEGELDDYEDDDIIDVYISYLRSRASETMKLSETFGFERVHGRGTINSPQHTKVGQQPREGRPNSEKIKKRPNKNLWFKDDRFWKNDLDLERGGNYKLVTDEDEERVVACDNDQAMAYGYWDKKKQMGITYNKPRPMQMVVHPKTTFKDFVIQ